MSRLQVVQHTLGLDAYGRGTMYRNHFVSCPGHHDQPAIDSLVADGLMARNQRIDSELVGGMDSMVFYVTEAGKQWVMENSPKPPKIPRARARYLRFLEYGDAFDSFLEFCRWDALPERSWNGGPA